MSIDISVIWFVIIVFATLMYIVMDGFDLGIGMLFSVVHDGEERDVMVNSVAPVWDGNETWLVLGGAGLFGAFPLAYAVITDALVIPLTAMLIGLIFRGVAFEFRFKAVPSHRTFWDYAFAGGSLLATFSQGIVVGAFINGFAVADRRFAGSTLDWLTPFNLFCGLGLVVAYLLLGTTWLIMKSEGALQQRMRELTRKVLLALMVVIAVVSVWTPLGWRYVAERWFTLPNFFWFVPVPILVLALSLWIWRLSAPRQPRSSLYPDAGPDFPRLQRVGDQRLAEHYPTEYLPVGCRRAALQPGIYAAGGAAHYPGDPDVYRLELLRLSRQSLRQRGLSLSLIRAGR